MRQLSVRLMSERLLSRRLFDALMLRARWAKPKRRLAIRQPRGLLRPQRGLGLFGEKTMRRTVEGKVNCDG